MTYRGLAFVATFLVVSLIATDAVAQNYYQTSRPFVRSPQAMGMGDAGVAFPTRHNVFFHNPAHLSEAAGLIPRINILGVQGGVSTTVIDQIRFFRNELQPIIEEERGVANLEDAERHRVYAEAFETGRRRAFLNGDVLLPSVMLRTGPVGLGAGGFIHSHALYRFHGESQLREEDATPIPELEFAGRLDAMLVGSASLDMSHFGVSGLSAGLSAKFTRRYLSYKDEPLDAIDLREPVLVFRGNSIGLDLGLLYKVPLQIPGTLTGGIAVYDVLASDFNYTFDREISDTDPSESLIEAETLRVRELFGVSRSYRIGAAYTIPSLRGIVGETGVAIDYVGYQDPPFEQSFGSHMRVGAQAQLAGLVRARMGLAQTYFTIGAGIGLGFVQLDYTFYAVEERGIDAELAGRKHLLQVRVGL